MLGVQKEREGNFTKSIEMGINRHMKEKTEPEHLVNSQFYQQMSWTQMYNVPIVSYSSRPHSSVGPLVSWGWININWRNTPGVKFAQMMRGEIFASFLDTFLHFSPELKHLLLRLPHNLFWIAMVLVINLHLSSTQDQANSLQIPRQFIILKNVLGLNNDGARPVSLLSA